MIVGARSERNATPVRSGNLKVGGAGGAAFKLQKPPQMRVPRPSRGRRACPERSRRGGDDDGLYKGGRRTGKSWAGRIPLHPLRKFKAGPCQKTHDLEAPL